MIAVLIQFFILFLSNLTALGVIYMQSSIQTKSIFIGILVLLLIFSQKFLLKAKSKKITVIRWLFLYLSSLLVELLVTVTGGFYSSFFILLHFYGLGLGFFVGLTSSIIFILLSSIGLMVQLTIDPRLKTILIQDPGSLILYILSYLIIIPFSYFLTQQFQLKSKLASLMEQEVQIGKVVMREITEMIIVTNLELKVLSVSDMVEKTLKTSRNELVGKSVFDIMFLRTSDGQMINPHTLLIDQIVHEKDTKNIQDLNLYIKNSSTPLKVQLSIKSVPDLNGSIEQLTFILNTVETVPQGQDVSEESLIKRIQIQQQAQLEDMRQKLMHQHVGSLASQIYLIQNWGHDLLLLNEIKHIASEKVFAITDVAQLTNNIVTRRQEFNKLINITMSFHLINFTRQDIASHVPPGTNVELMDMTSPFFSAPLVVRWYDTMMNKMLFIATLLALGTVEKKVQVTIDRYDENTLKIGINIPQLAFLPEDKDLLFVKGYKSLLTSTNLYFSSGLEGYLAQQIAKELNMPLESKYDKDTKTLQLMIFIDKRPASK